MRTKVAKTPVRPIFKRHLCILAWRKSTASQLCADRAAPASCSFAEGQYWVLDPGDDFDRIYLKEVSMKLMFSVVC